MGHDGIDRTSEIVPRLFWRAFVRQTDSPYIEQRLATTWEPLGSLCVRRDRSGQGELKSCTLPGGTGGPQAAAMRLDDRATDGQPLPGPVILGVKDGPKNLAAFSRGQS